MNAWLVLATPGSGERGHQFLVSKGLKDDALAQRITGAARDKEKEIGEDYVAYGEPVDQKLSGGVVRTGKKVLAFFGPEIGDLAYEAREKLQSDVKKEFEKLAQSGDEATSSTHGGRLLVEVDWLSEPLDRLRGKAKDYLEQKSGPTLAVLLAVTVIVVLLAVTVIGGGLAFQGPIQDFFRSPLPTPGENAEPTPKGGDAEVDLVQGLASKYGVSNEDIRKQAAALDRPVQQWSEQLANNEANLWMFGVTETGFPRDDIENRTASWGADEIRSAVTDLSELRDEMGRAWKIQNAAKRWKDDLRNGLGDDSKALRFVEKLIDNERLFDPESLAGVGIDSFPLFTDADIKLLRNLHKASDGNVLPFLEELAKAPDSLSEEINEIVDAKKQKRLDGFKIDAPLKRGRRLWESRFLKELFGPRPVNETEE